MSKEEQLSDAERCIILEAENRTLRIKAANSDSWKSKYTQMAIASKTLVEENSRLKFNLRQKDIELKGLRFDNELLRIRNQKK